jgi:hypothetical protein
MVLGTVLLLLFAVAASAQAPMREFTGSVDRVDETKLVIDNRMQDRVTFVRFDRTQVKGERRKWSQLRPGDRVTVSWRFVDKPKKAYVVQVLRAGAKQP